MPHSGSSRFTLTMPSTADIDRLTSVKHPKAVVLTHASERLLGAITGH